VESACISITIAELRSLVSIQDDSAAEAARGTQSIPPHYGAKKGNKPCAIACRKIPLLDERSGHNIPAKRIGGAIRLEKPAPRRLMRLLAALDAYLEVASTPRKATTSSTSTRCVRPTSVSRRASRGRGRRVRRAAHRFGRYGEVKRMFVHPEARGRNWGARS